jgi:hypothetical protein
MNSLGGKLSTRFRRENGPGGSSSERRVLVGNFPGLERPWRPVLRLDLGRAAGKGQGHGY